MSEPSSQQPASESEIATPPRGTATAPEPATEPPPEHAGVWGEQPQPPSPAARKDRRMQLIWVAALVLGLVGTGWISSEYFRDVWSQSSPREVVPVAADGSATLAGITVTLVEATDLGATPSLPGSDWTPPAGLHAWRVVLETSSTNEDLTTCDVAIVDARGRQFWANYFVDSFVEGYQWTYRCGVLQPEDDIGPQQALLVLVPADAEVRTVRIWSALLVPELIELEI